MGALSPSSVLYSDPRKGGSFSGNGKNSAPECLAQQGKNLLFLRNAVSPEKGYAAGRFTDPGANLERAIGRPHLIGGIRKARG
jgi:hypothetical protein